MKKIIYVTITLAAIFSSCKKSDPENDDPTPAAPVTAKAITRSDLYAENGFISGTITGQLSSGAAFTKEFIHELDDEMNTYYANPQGRYVIHISKLDKYGSIGGNDKKTAMTFILNNDKVSVRSLDDFKTSVFADSSATAITRFTVSTTSGNGFGNVSFSNVSFNTTTGLFTCDYIVTVLGGTTSSGKQAQITGEINTYLTNIRYRTGS